MITRAATALALDRASPPSASAARRLGRRHLGGGSGGGRDAPAESPSPFDGNVKRLQRARAARSCRRYHDRHYRLDRRRSRRSADDPTRMEWPAPAVLPYDYFHVEVARRLVDRLDDIDVRPGGFPLALELGARGNVLRDAIVDGVEGPPLLLDDDDDDDDDDRTTTRAAGGRGGIRRLVRVDPCEAVLRRDDVDGVPPSSSSSSSLVETFDLESTAVDGRSPLPFPENTFDVVLSSMHLHWADDLPRLLSEVERVLRPDGCLLFAFPGGDTLPELRSSMVLAEMERSGGASTHVGPYVDPGDVGGLLTGAGLRLPTIDVDDVRVGYPDAMVLMEHLGRMGEGNACASRRDRVGLGTFLGAACLYGELYPEEGEGVGDDDDDDDGGVAGEGRGIVASARVIYGIAWKEHESQQRPDDRGSATHKLADISVTRTPAGALRGRRRWTSWKQARRAFSPQMG
ncbi:hypothetical protein ACHAW5_008631 [Stephanodiscus triporus]|uniref:Methyltransferase type 11 domain-containing protein n=1 Tax=Stephanodiscus triporus TaxID=2934178 RepID=A0ABD3Q2X5_9STRA